jgi:hypothetical protein
MAFQKIGLVEQLAGLKAEHRTLTEERHRVERAPIAPDDLFRAYSREIDRDYKFAKDRFLKYWPAEQPSPKEHLLWDVAVVPTSLVDQLRDVFYLAGAELLKQSVKKIIFDSVPPDALGAKEKTARLGELDAKIEANEREQMKIIVALEDEGVKPNYFDIRIPNLLEIANGRFAQHRYERFWKTMVDSKIASRAPMTGSAELPLRFTISNPTWAGFLKTRDIQAQAPTFRKRETESPP